MIIREAGPLHHSPTQARLRGPELPEAAPSESVSGSFAGRWRRGGWAPLTQRPGCLPSLSSPSPWFLFWQECAGGLGQVPHPIPAPLQILFPAWQQCERNKQKRTPVRPAPDLEEFTGR